MPARRPGPAGIDDTTAFDDGARDLARVRFIVCAELIAGLLLSLPLWTSAGRLYPIVPVVEGLPRFPATLDAAALVTLVIVLLAAAISERAARWALPCAVALVTLLVVNDRSRLQPWVYLDTALLVVIAWSLRPGCEAGALSTLRFVLAATYLWSGIQKANVTFVTQTWADTAAPLLGVLPPHFAAPVRAAGIVIPLVEIAIGCALLTPRFRRAAVIGAVVTHLTVLALLVIAGENSVVWPWNLAMPLLAFVLFWNVRTGAREVLFWRRAPLHVLAVFLFGLMPALSFFGLWDPYVSGALYSGNTAQAVVYVDPARIERLPALVRRSTWQQSSPMFIDINRWSYDELNVPAYQEPRTLKKIGRRICIEYASSGATALAIFGRPHWRSGDRSREFYTCTEAAR